MNINIIDLNNILYRRNKQLLRLVGSLRDLPDLFQVDSRVCVPHPLRIAGNPLTELEGLDQLGLLVYQKFDQYFDRQPESIDSDLT